MGGEVIRALALLLALSVSACSYTSTHVAGRSPSRALFWGDVALSASSLVAVAPWTDRDDSTPVRLVGTAVLFGAFALFGMSGASVLHEPPKTKPSDCIAEWERVHGFISRIPYRPLARPLACEMGD